MEIGAIIKDQYKVIEHIGRGGMADVWSARDLRLRRLVAIKTIAKGLSPDVDPVGLFEKEAQTIAQMEHPHILPIYDFGEYEASLYIVMRFITGGSLEDLLRKAPMQPDDVLTMGDAIARALDYAHENNVIHLDLKPPNILLGSGQTPYLADFGLATVLDLEGRARNPGSGTLLYMAPEQLVSETIDHRADIYSFCIMLFHMFTGNLPFDGTIPLALSQLQSGRSLPDVDEVRGDLPYQISDILRRGTMQSPFDRPYTHKEIMSELRELLAPTPISGSSLEWNSLEEDDAPERVPLNATTQQMVAAGDMGLLEAVDIYSRARHQWAGGQGRFDMGMSHFMLMCEYYQATDHYALDIDDSGYQMLLRGALEYDYELAYWWSKLNDDNRRRVCLHTLRSLNPPARIRAMFRLETLPDDAANPVIPRLVSQALEIEPSPEGRIAALRVLATRAKLLKPRQKYEIKTQFQGRLLNSMTRLGIQVTPPDVWQETVYTPEVDLLIAETALDTEAPEVAEVAARSIGQIRSLTAARYVSDAQRSGRSGALQALAFIRDEAPALPDVVSRQGRLYAWLTNTVRRLTDEPLQAILRFVLALLGGWIGMGELVYTLFRSQALFTAQRWGNAIAIGLIFGLFVAITVMVADEFSRRLDKFWHWWLRLCVALGLGYLLGTLTWGSFTWMYFNYTPEWDVMRLGGAGLALGLVVSALIRLKSWQAILLTTFMGFLPIASVYRIFYYSQYSTIVLTAPIGVVIGAGIGWWLRRQNQPPSGVVPLIQNLNRPMRVALSGAAGFVGAVALWLFYLWVFQGFLQRQYLTWDGVLALFMLSLLIGLAAGYWLKKTTLPAFVLTFVASCLAFEWSISRSFYNPPFYALDLLSWRVPEFNGVPFAPRPGASILYFDPEQVRASAILTIALPMMLVIALGANMRDLLAGWWRFVGAPQTEKERGAWLTGVLIYVLIATAAISILALFSMHVNVAWAALWSAIGFAIFVFALAAWRWALWGARGLLAGAGVVLAGGFLFDVYDMLLALDAGKIPPLFQMWSIPLHPGGNSSLMAMLNTAPALWLAWAIILVFSIRAVTQRRRWGFVSLPIAVAILAVALVLLWNPASTQPEAAVGSSSFVLATIITTPSIVFYSQATFLWGLWAVLLGICTWGAYRRLMWGGIGLIGLLLGWLAMVLFAGIPGSMAVLAATHVALLAYALRPDWAQMEAGRWQMATAASASQPEARETLEMPIADMMTRPIQYPDQETRSALSFDPALLETRFDFIENLPGAKHVPTEKLPAAAQKTLPSVQPTALEPLNLDTAPVRPPTVKLDMRDMEAPERAATEIDIASQIADQLPKPVIAPMQLDAGQLQTPPNTEAPKKPLPQIRVNTDRMRTDANAPKTSAPAKPSIKLNTTGLRSQPMRPKEEDTLPASPPLQIDTERLRGMKTETDLQNLQDKPDDEAE